MRRIITVVFILISVVFAGCSKTEETKRNDTAKKNVVIENIMSRRSVRSYRPDKIDSASMHEILWCGINAPNGQGRESWEVRVVNNQRFIENIDSLYNEYVSNVLKLEKAGHHVSYGAPVIVFIAYDTTYDLSQVDCGLLGENMILAANAMGIGSCCLGGLCRFINSEDGAGILQKLNLPSTHRLLYAIAFGYPDQVPQAKPRNMGKVQFVGNDKG